MHSTSKKSSSFYENIESNVRSYCRGCSAEFATGNGSYLFDSAGNAYLDFLAGCGSLNYGHNEPNMKAALIDYIMSDGLALGLDFHSTAKRAFLDAFDMRILRPRGLDYRVQFTGPTGTNAVEAALKLARKHTERSVVVAFTNAFHGCSLGALAATGNIRNRSSSEGQLHNIHRAPYDGYAGAPGPDSASLLEKMLDDPSSGVGPIAAVIFEAIQGEGGLNCSSPEWAQKICTIAKRRGALVIVDEIQAGCGRSGDFFAFEHLGIKPDIVTMAKSLSGFGLPMSLTLIAPEFDVWSPGEHNGTFRGNAHAFVTATVALNVFWSNDDFVTSVRRKAQLLRERLDAIASAVGAKVVGRGMMQGLDVGSGAMAEDISQACLKQGLLLETCGAQGQVLKCLMSLTIGEDDLEKGLSILNAAAGARLGQSDDVKNDNIYEMDLVR